jgi:NAD(P)-dependent dehydrogenase (short-subunit alcohol dehydrogenase family)
MATGEQAMDRSGLKGKVALVTGGAGAIGTATCQRFAEAGVKVAIADLQGDAAGALATAIRSEGGDAEGFAVDLRSEDEIVKLVADVMTRFGRIDILHNNAAAGIGTFDKDPALLDLPTEIWDRTFAVNVRGPMILSRTVIPHMLESGNGGIIINTSSGASEIPSADSCTAYGPSKSALETLTRYIAMQYGAQGVRCNAIVVGAVLTPDVEIMFTPAQIETFASRTMLHRVNMPEDIAAMAVFLASDDARQVTGQLIRVDGGRP